MKIIVGDFLEMKNGDSFEVIEGSSHDGVSGSLVVVRVDLNNNHLGPPFSLEVGLTTPIIDVIR